MANTQTFKQMKGGHFKTLQQYAPIVARVHGGHHPEFHEVRTLLDAIMQKAKDAGNRKAELHEEFSRLREITGNYTVPNDVCESYEAVYVLLSELDRAYHA